VASTCCAGNPSCAQSASVAAGKGGATSTTTVDMNGRYLEWAQRNLAANKLKPERNTVVEADVLTWVAQTDERYGLIYLDPPTFSNSKKMGGSSRDEVRKDWTSTPTRAFGQRRGAGFNIRGRMAS